MQQSTQLTMQWHDWDEVITSLKGKCVFMVWVGEETLNKLFYVLCFFREKIPEDV